MGIVYGKKPQKEGPIMGPHFLEHIYLCSFLSQSIKLPKVTDGRF